MSASVPSSASGVSQPVPSLKVLFSKNVDNKSTSIFDSSNKKNWACVAGVVAAIACVAFGAIQLAAALGYLSLPAVASLMSPETAYASSATLITVGTVIMMKCAAFFSDMFKNIDRLKKADLTFSIVTTHCEGLQSELKKPLTLTLDALSSFTHNHNGLKKEVDDLYKKWETIDKNGDRFPNIKSKASELMLKTVSCSGWVYKSLPEYFSTAFDQIEAEVDAIINNPNPQTSTIDSYLKSKDAFLQGVSEHINKEITNITTRIEKNAQPVLAPALENYKNELMSNQSRLQNLNSTFSKKKNIQNIQELQTNVSQIKSALQNISSDQKEKQKTLTEIYSTLDNKKNEATFLKTQFQNDLEHENEIDLIIQDLDKLTKFVTTSLGTFEIDSLKTSAQKAYKKLQDEINKLKITTQTSSAEIFFLQGQIEKLGKEVQKIHAIDSKAKSVNVKTLSNALELKMLEALPEPKTKSKSAIDDLVKALNENSAFNGTLVKLHTLTPEELKDWLIGLQLSSIDDFRNNFIYSLTMLSEWITLKKPALILKNDAALVDIPEAPKDIEIIKLINFLSGITDLPQVLTHTDNSSIPTANVLAKMESQFKMLESNNNFDGFEPPINAETGMRVKNIYRHLVQYFENKKQEILNEKDTARQGRLHARLNAKLSRVLEDLGLALYNKSDRIVKISENFYNQYVLTDETFLNSQSLATLLALELMVYKRNLVQDFCVNQGGDDDVIASNIRYFQAKLNDEYCLGDTGLAITPPNSDATALEKQEKKLREYLVANLTWEKIVHHLKSNMMDNKMKKILSAERFTQWFSQTYGFQPPLEPNSNEFDTHAFLILLRDHKMITHGSDLFSHQGKVNRSRRPSISGNPLIPGNNVPQSGTKIVPGTADKNVPITANKKAPLSGKIPNSSSVRKGNRRNPKAE